MMLDTVALSSRPDQFVHGVHHATAQPHIKHHHQVGEVGVLYGRTELSVPLDLCPSGHWTGLTLRWIGWPRLMDSPGTPE